jgi:agarase
VTVSGGNSLAVTPVLEIAKSYLTSLKDCPTSVRTNEIPDVFNPDFANFARKFCRKSCVKWKNNPHILILGWYSDSEQGWKPDWRSKSNQTLLIRFLDFPITWPGHQAAVNFVIRRYGSIGALDRIWHAKYHSWRQFSTTKVKAPFTPPVPYYIYNPVLKRKFEVAHPYLHRYLTDCSTFAGLVADRYFKICCKAIKLADPNHLYLGAKFTYFPGSSVMVACAKYTDVISVDDYSRNAIPSILPYASFGRPVLIGEFSFRAKDSDVTNTIGTGPLVDTQSQRVQGMIRYVKQALSIPEVIGYCWFEYYDESAHGAPWSRENSNYGLVRRNGMPYRKLTSAFKNLNGLANRLHAAARAIPIPQYGFNTN